MSAFAPASAVLARRIQTQQALQTHYAGTITINEVDYACQVHVGSVEYEQLPEGEGAKLIQRFVCTVLKTVLATVPARGTVLLHGGQRFQVGKTEGRSGAEPAWVVHAHRLPKEP